ncbi:MAG: hypothetical protein MUO73_02700 [Thermoplasmata archaeon]|nr:hypothetical protein [Thermoplasmata archaeon]
MAINRGVLHFSTGCKHIHSLTGMNVEKRAVMELIIYFEASIDKVILQSEKEREQLNSRKKIQGLHQKSRIDAECIQRAIKNLNTGEYPPSSKRTGGLKQEGEKNVLHKKEEHGNQGVETA